MARPTGLDIDKAIPVIMSGIEKSKSKVEIAQELGISRNTLHYWITKYPEIRKLFETH